MTEGNIGRDDVENVKLARGTHKEIQEAIDVAHPEESLQDRIKRDREIERRLVDLLAGL